MRFYWLLLGILGVWRVTHLLHAEDGPWKLLYKLRAILGRTLLGQLFDCFYCLSLWISAPREIHCCESRSVPPAAIRMPLKTLPSSVSIDVVAPTLRCAPTARNRRDGLCG